MIASAPFQEVLSSALTPITLLKAEIQGVQKSACVEAAFSVDYDRWILKQGDLASPGLVLYLMADGSFAVWDSERNRKSREKEAPPDDLQGGFQWPGG